MAVTKTPLKSWAECKALTGNFYKNLATAKQEGKILGWMGASMPPELMRAFEIVPIFGEPYGATCAFNEPLTRQLLRTMDNAGFTRDLCGYSRVFVGSILEGKSHMGPFPTPDFIAEIKCGCSTHFKWWETASRLTGAPLFVMDTPLAPRGVEEYHVQYFSGMLERLIRFLEGVTGRKLDEERFVESVTLAQQATELWDGILECCKAVPSPLDFKSLLTLMVPSFLLRGSPEAVAFYERLLEEVRERVRLGIGAADEEKKRILWDNIPMWYNLSIFSRLDQYGAVIVVSPYTSMWGSSYKTMGLAPGEKLSPFQPNPRPANYREALRALAEYSADKAIGLDYRTHLRLFRAMIEQYKIDGIIAHSNRGCKGLSNGRLDLLSQIQQTCGVPVLIFESNSADPEDFAEGQIRTRVEAFLEILFKD